VIAIKIRKEWREKAERHQSKMSGLSPGGNYTGVEIAGRWYNGKLAELAFDYMLDQMDTRYQYTEVEDRPDDQDFIVYYADKPLTIDVKSSNGSHTNYLATPIKRFEKDSHHLYVGVRLVDEYAEIIGYKWRPEMELLDNKKHPFDKMFQEPNMGCHYDDCHPIEDLLKNIEKRKR